MSEYFAHKLVDKMIVNSIIDIRKREEYLYAVQILLEKSIGLFLSFIIALITGTIVETTLFLLPFISIRKYSGGYHCKTDIGCLAASQIFVVVSVLVEAPFFLRHGLLANIVFVIMTGYLLLVGSINHPDMNWSPYELERSKEFSIKMVIIWVLLLVCLEMCGVSLKILIYIIIGIMNVSFLMLLARIKKQEVKTYAEEN